MSIEKPTREEIVKIARAEEAAGIVDQQTAGAAAAIAAADTRQPKTIDVDDETLSSAVEAPHRGAD